RRRRRSFEDGSWHHRSFRGEAQRRRPRKVDVSIHERRVGRGWNTEGRHERQVRRYAGCEGPRRNASLTDELHEPSCASARPAGAIGGRRTSVPVVRTAIAQVVRATRTTAAAGTIGVRLAGMAVLDATPADGREERALLRRGLPRTEEPG